MSNDQDRVTPPPAGPDVPRLVEGLLSADGTAALRERDALAERDRAGLAAGLSRVVADGAASTDRRAKAAWLLKDLCSEAAWPDLESVLIDPQQPRELRLTILDTAERLAFAGGLSDLDLARMTRVIIDDPGVLRAWVAVLVTLGNSHAIQLLLRYGTVPERLEAVLNGLRDTPAPWADEVLLQISESVGPTPELDAVLAARGHARLVRQLRETCAPDSVDEGVTMRLFEHGDIALIESLVERRCLTEKAEELVRRFEPKELVSRSQRRLLVRVRAKLAESAGRRQ